MNHGSIWCRKKAAAACGAHNALKIARFIITWAKFAANERNDEKNR